jgi:hypothetical protein
MVTHSQIPPIGWHGSRFTGGLLADRGTPEQDGQVYLASDTNEIYVGIEAGNAASWIKIYPPTYLTVREVDGTPNVSPVTEIRVSNGKLTNNGSGSVTVDLSGDGGGGGGSSLAVARVRRTSDVEWVYITYSGKRRITTL